MTATCSDDVVPALLAPRVRRAEKSGRGAWVVEYFGRWAVASWPPSAAEIAADRAQREAYLDAHRPGWRAVQGR